MLENFVDGFNLVIWWFKILVQIKKPARPTQGGKIDICKPC